MSQKRISIIVVIIVAVLLLAPLVVPKFVPWSGINCRHQEINIKTGQARYSRILWFIKISERVEDTPLSLVLHGETLNVNNIKPWHRVNTFSTGIHHSPHYIFHSAFGQARDLVLILDMHNSSELQRKDAVVGLLAIWQKSGNGSKAGTYLNELQRQLEQGDPADSSIAS
jgi:hypothetical protein